MLRVSLVGASVVWLASTLLRAQAPAPPPSTRPAPPVASVSAAGRIDYATQIQPILAEFCADCHDAETRKGLRLTLAGKGTKPFALAGSYPAGKPFNEAVRSLSGSFEVAFDQLNYNEIDTRDLALPIAQTRFGPETSGVWRSSWSSAIGHCGSSKPRRGSTGRSLPKVSCC